MFDCSLWVFWTWVILMSEKKPYFPKNMAVKTRRNTKSRATQNTAPGFSRLSTSEWIKDKHMRNPTGRHRKPPTSNSGSFKVLQLNIQGCLTLCHTELWTDLIQRDAHIVLLFEKEREYSLPGYVCDR
ncbi:hypothetical protein PoB_005033800 [Plakobranchus ocellatus]|uniref:Uncharacterized protein n=1 Tax=Plakobranchus ocellatus TaxID=259542 RepID=A0AAV4BYE9_9GAST|nr:hypothetical protein PoB_005033800 [Plakobranchus ocellatus]